MEKNKTPVPVSASAAGGDRADGGKDGNDNNESVMSGADPAAVDTDSKMGAEAPGTDGAATRPPAPPRRTIRRRGWGKVLLLLIIVAVAAAGYYLWPRYAPWLGEYFPAIGTTADDTSRVPATERYPADNSHPDNSHPDGSHPDTTTADSSVSDSATTAPPAARSGSAESEKSELAKALVAEVEERRQQIEQLQGQIADLHLQLNSQQDQLRRLSTTTREDWLLAEAEYLLRLASQRILTERQTANAVALMSSADAILRGLNDTELFPVRKALADDITQARMAEAVDREGLYLRIGALVAAVDRLHSLLPDPQTAASADTDAAPEPARWHRRLLVNARQAVARLVGLVRIERRDLPLQPMLTLEQEQALRDNLRVVLEQARLALLREEPAIYQASLARAEYWVAGNFEQDQVAQIFRADLAELRQQPVVSELPSLTGSLRALQEYIRLWHNRHGDPEAAAGNRAGSPADTPTTNDSGQDAEPLAASGGEGEQS